MKYDTVAVDVEGIGKVMFVLPAIDESYPPELKSALGIRREATLNRRCACGGMMNLPNREMRRHGVQVTQEHALIVHEDDCPASDGAIFELADRLGVEM